MKTKIQAFRNLLPEKFRVAVDELHLEVIILGAVVWTILLFRYG